MKYGEILIGLRLLNMNSALKYAFQKFWNASSIKIHFVKLIEFKIL